MGGAPGVGVLAGRLLGNRGWVWFREAETESEIVVPEPQSQYWLPGPYGKILLTSVVTSYIRCWMPSRVDSCNYLI